MEKKNVFYALFLVGLMALFAILVIAANGHDVAVSSGISLVSINSTSGMYFTEGIRANLSGTVTFNISNRSVTNDVDLNLSALNVTLLGVSNSLVYNITNKTLADGFADSAGTNNSWRVSFNTALVSDGVYNISFYGHNLTNNATIMNQSVLKSASEFITIDNTAPNITIHSPTNGSYITTGGSFNFNATVMNDTRFTVVHYVNMSNNTNYAIKWNASNRGGDFWNITYNVTDLLEGENYLYVSANDTAGNLNNSKYVRVYVDTQQPAVNLTSPANWTWTTDTTPEFTVIYVDSTSPNASCRLFVDNIQYETNATVRNNTAWVFSTETDLGVGAHIWGVNCTDLAGNQNRSRVNYTLDIVERPTLTAPANNSWIANTTNSNIKFTFNFTTHAVNTTRNNNVTCELFVMNGSSGYNRSGVNNATPNNTATTILNNDTLMEGSIYSIPTKGVTWYVNCSYNSTYIISDTQTINVDVTAPTVNIQETQTLRNYTWTDDSTPDLYFNFTDGTSNRSSCELFIDETKYGVNSSVWNYTGIFLTANHSLAEGAYSWYVNCTDLAGNVGTSRPGYMFEYRLVYVTSPANNTWTQRTAANGLNVSFNFTSRLNASSENSIGKRSNVSCELWITNASGGWVHNGVNATTHNSTLTILGNNMTFTNGLTMNWTVNCTWNGTIISTPARSYQVKVDNATPTLTLTSTPSETSATISATTNEIATCKISSSNVGWTDMSPFGTTAGTSHSVSAVSLAASTAYTRYVLCRDDATNEVSGSTSFTTTAGTSGGSGSGGSGGGATTTALGQFAKETWASINAGETATVKVTNGEIGVIKVSFVVGKTTYGAWAKVEKLDSLPSTVGSPSSKIYKNIQITESNVQKALKDTATVDFKVTKTWLSEKKVAKENVVLFRYVGTKWTELKTVLGQDDGTYVHYTAETPGFSYFAIGEKAGAAPAAKAETATPATKTTAPITEEAATTETKGETAAAPVTSKGLSKGWIVTIIIALVVILAAVYFWKKK